MSSGHEFNLRVDWWAQAAVRNWANHHLSQGYLWDRKWQRFWVEHSPSSYHLFECKKGDSNDVVDLNSHLLKKVNFESLN